MAELANCPNCGKLYVKNPVRDVCEDCYREEEAAFERVFQFLRKRENRAATIETIVEKNHVPEKLVFKWVRNGRLLIAHFPNLAYPCDRCGKLIQSGKLCEECAKTIAKDLERFEKEKKRQEEIRKKAYHIK
nr:TIGR03826 family flagellar region protein [Heyndrickxia coagulans]